MGFYFGTSVSHVYVKLVFLNCEKKVMFKVVILT